MRLLHPIMRFLWFMYQYGFRATVARAYTKITGKTCFSICNYISKRTARRQRAHCFPKSIKFSILVPLYNTPQRFLKEMIESVQAQTYGNWELCLADGSDDAHDDVAQTVRQYSETDPRIRYLKLVENRGISGNTNACLDMATGDYIAFFDHDDLLCVNALFENMKAICELDADFLYSDEDKTDSESKLFYAPVYKPDFSIDLIRSTNYICHFVVVSKKICEQAGYLKNEYNGSQDYDYVLRCLDYAKRVHHIPKVLYHWRAHENSTAQSYGSKGYAAQAGRKALCAYVERHQLEASVECLPNPGTYRLHYAIKGQPLISILIPNRDQVDTLRRCISAVLDRSTYPHFEVIIIDDHSVEARTFSYYESLSNNKRVRVIKFEGTTHPSKIKNFGAQHANGEYLLFLNRQTEVITPDWIQALLAHAQREEVGVVGAKMYFPHNAKIQHAGVIVGLGDSASYALRQTENLWNRIRLTVTHNLSAVGGDCMMLRRGLFSRLGEFNENYATAFEDVDLCLRARARGLWVVWTPFCELFYHTQSDVKIRKRKTNHIQRDRKYFAKTWSHYWQNGDPFYNIHFKNPNYETRNPWSRKLLRSIKARFPSFYWKLKRMKTAQP